VAPGSNTWTALPVAPDNSHANFSTGEQNVAVDTAGNVYAITTAGVLKLAPGSNNWTALGRVDRMHILGSFATRATGILPCLGCR
jgi:hypothetical protein